MANRGFTLVELLVGSVIGTMVLSFSAKLVEMNLQSTNVAKAGLVENDFKQTIAKGLENEGCHETDHTKATLKPDSLNTSALNKADGIGAFKSGFSLNSIKVGDFKGSIKVVKMELRGVATEDTRDFVVYYKHINLGSLSAPDPDNCKNDPTIKVTGCFEQRCTVNYKNPSPGDSNPGHCTGSVNCHSFSGGGSSGNPDCYKVDTFGKTLVGCDDTKDAGGTNTTAIGYGAGKDLTGGSDNIAIGHSVQLVSPTGSNQINIGNIIQAKQEAVDSTDTTKGNIGVLEICNANSGKCLILRKTSFTCPDKDGVPQYFRGIDDNGNPICQKENFCPQSLHHWTPENLCHKCPRDSPLYRANANPPDCVSCDSNSVYILTGTNKNTCQPCPTGQIPVDGVCQCRSDYVLVDGHCCHKNSPYYHSGGCRNCPTARHRLNLQTNQCNCHDWWPEEYDGGCHSCPKNHIFISFGIEGNLCCPPDKPLYDHSEQKCSQCPTEHVFSNGHCCHKNYPHYHGGQCNRCRSDQVQYDGNKCCDRPYYYMVDGNDQCNQCLETEVLSNGHCCPEDTPYHYDGQCNQCRSAEYLVDGRCLSCPTTGHRINLATRDCECHPFWPQFYDGECHYCPQNQVKVGSKRIENPSPQDDGLLTPICCPSNKPKYRNGECSQCDQETPHFWNEQCNKCPKATPYWENATSTCHPCDINKGMSMIDGRCQCPINVPTTIDSNGKCKCPDENPWLYYYVGFDNTFNCWSGILVRNQTCPSGQSLRRFGAGLSCR